MKVYSPMMGLESDFGADNLTAPLPPSTAPLPAAVPQIVIQTSSTPSSKSFDLADALILAVAAGGALYILREKKILPKLVV